MKEDKDLSNEDKDSSNEDKDLTNEGKDSLNEDNDFTVKCLNFTKFAIFLFSSLNKQPNCGGFGPVHVILAKIFKLNPL